MRPILIATAALAVATSAASAAGFDVNAGATTNDDISSGISTIESCTDALKADVEPGAYNGADDWDVLHVEVADATDATLTACTGFEVTVQLDFDGGTEDLGTQTVAGSEASLTFLVDGAADVEVEEVESISILVDEPGI